jgi:hypothetical protein
MSGGEAGASDLTLTEIVGAVVKVAPRLRRLNTRLLTASVKHAVVRSLTVAAPRFRMTWESSWSKKTATD